VLAGKEAERLMNVRGFPHRRLLALITLAISVVVFSGCGALGGPQNTFAPDGDVADLQRDLFIMVLIPAIIVLFLVFGALLYILVRFRHREGAPLPKQVHGNVRLEVAWTILPMILLVGLTVPTLKGIIDLGHAPKNSDLHVTVVASQWQWQFQYTDPEFATSDGSPLTTKELHMPVGRQVGFTLESRDVIHSFWVPKLAGKLDVMPGRHNQLRFNATEAGTYSAQCAEFCGIGHPAMKFTVIAQSTDDFQAWAQQQLTAPAQ
jgi:cytochrome c oxidase subunit 2